MTKLVLKNKELAPAINFLQDLNLKASDSRHRTKLVKLLVKAFEELGQEERELMGSFDLLDEEGSLKAESDRNIDNVILYNKEQAILMDEEVTIEGGTYAKNIDKVQSILQKYEGELSGEKADIYDKLLDEFEKNQQEDAE